MRTKYFQGKLPKLYQDTGCHHPSSCVSRLQLSGHFVVSSFDTVFNLWLCLGGPSLSLSLSDAAVAVSWQQEACLIVYWSPNINYKINGRNNIVNTLSNNNTSFSLENYLAGLQNKISAVALKMFLLLWTKQNRKQIYYPLLSWHFFFPLCSHSVLIHFC